MPATPYLERINALRERAVAQLIRLGVPNTAIDFDAEHKRGRRPGDARSEFLANRALGDWAEGRLALALSSALTPRGYSVLKYGNSDDIVAGDPRFPEFYDKYQDELASHGKRPDLLIFKTTDTDPSWAGSIANLELSALKDIAGRAVAAIEVRSSKTFALKYAEYRRQEHEDKPSSKTPLVCSFTPKIEDLRLVNRWLQYYSVPHFYVQVFFDSIYGISFEAILEILGSTESGLFTIQKNRNNQEKPTIHIPVTAGVQLATLTRPEFSAKVQETRLARLDAYVVPEGGDVTMLPGAVEKLLATSMVSL